MKKFQYVDALRGIAILGVVMVHCGQYGTNDYPDKIKHLLEFGSLGVQLFFVASAFTLFLSMHNRKERGETGNTDFFIRRFFRIAPMYYIGITYYLFQNGLGPSFWLGDATHVSTLNIVCNFLFLHGFDPYYFNSVVPGGWSIAVEMLFYCFVPLLFKYITNMNRALIFFLIAAVFRMIGLLVMQQVHICNDPILWQEYLNLYFPSQLQIFACGFILYFLITVPGSLRKSNVWILAVLILAFVTDYVIRKVSFFPIQVKFAIGFIALGYLLSRKPIALLVNPIICNIGKISYSMYLVHFAVLYWLTKSGHADFIHPVSLATGIANLVVRFVVVLIGSSVLAAIFYNVIELPFQKLGSQLIKKRQQQKVNNTVVA
jgi:peptidoglycan/LPS O-acetylase OafA/YrhL